MELFDSTDPNWPPDPKDIDLYDGSWLRAKQAADAARVDVRTIWRWRRKRDIAIKVGGILWFNKHRMFGK